MLCLLYCAISRSTYAPSYDLPIGALHLISTAKMLLAQRVTVIRVARMQDPGIVELELNKTWKRTKIRDAPPA